MQKYFNIFLEFDHKIFNSVIENAIKNRKKGYVCVIDGNVLAISNRDETYRTIVNDALVNTCDGSSIALMINIIHKKKYHAYTGPEIFNYYIRKGYKQFFLGNTEDILNKLRSCFEKESIDTNSMRFSSLPFLKVDEFDYLSIGKMINEYSPDLIWVSLGAPKQEIFMDKLYPCVDRGILFAIGAAFNFYLGDDQNKRAPELLRRMHLEWIFRFFQEPKKIGKRAINYLILLPKLFLDELKRTKNITHN